MTRFLLLPLIVAASIAHANEPAKVAKADPAKGQAIATTVCVACQGPTATAPAPPIRSWPASMPTTCSSR